MTKHPAKIDVAVLMLFFTRTDSFQKVFDEVRRARPSKLFLFQDGPRGERDMAGIEACRRIVSDDEIDWECEVHRNYQERNLGCDPAEYVSQKWAFSMVDKCIVLEDDDVPSQSFFPYDYLFTSVFSIWGWASWRRVIDRWEGDYRFLDDAYSMRQLEALVRQRDYRRDAIAMFRNHRATGKEYYESIFWADMLLHSGLAILPSKNLINNMGASADSTHFGGSLYTMPRGLRRIFTMKRHELQFPLRHPKYVIEDVDYKERFYKTYAWNHPLTKIGYSLEELWLNLREGNFSYIGKSVKRRLRKWMGTDRHK